MFTNKLVMNGWVIKRVGFIYTVHQNYIGVDGAREPYLLSVVQEGGAGLLRAILFNKMVSNERVCSGVVCCYVPYVCGHTLGKVVTLFSIRM